MSKTALGIPFVHVVVHIYEKHAIAHALARSRIYIRGVIPNPESSPIFAHVSTRSRQYVLEGNLYLFMKGVRLEFFHVFFHPKLYTFFTTPIVCVPFPFYFMEFLPAISPLGRLCEPEKRG